MMRMILGSLAAALALTAAAPIDWTKRVTATPAGAFVMGNPAAKAKLVEYLSFTCSHCADYVAQSKDAVRRDFVAKGTTSIELRHAVRDRLDFVATLLARCGGPTRFFGNAEAILAAQDAWIAKGAAFEQANAPQIAKLPIDESIKLVARGAGFDALMKARGIAAPQMDKCLTDKAQQKLIGAMTESAWNEARIPGTPHFLINGTPVAGAHSWASLQPALSAAQN